MKVLFITNIPSPYRVDFFNELGKHCDLTVLFEKSTSDERDNSWRNYTFENFEGIFLKGKSYKTDGAVCFGVLKYLKRGMFDRIVCTDFSSPTGMLAIECMRLKGIEFYLEGDGGFKKSGKGFKEAVKRHFIKGAKGYFSTAGMHDEYYLAYGAEKDKILRYPFTSLKAEDIFETAFEYEQKLAVRKELGMTEKGIVLTVGRFIRSKGFDVLLNAAKQFPDDTGVYFVGGIPTEEYLNFVRENDLKNIHFIGFKSKSELKKYYIASDVFVLPTREDIWGLVINEAMACGLPVVTTDRCIAGLELVKNGVNGYIVSVGNVQQTADSINKIIGDRALAEKMSANSIKIIKDYTIENMAERHKAVFSKED